MRVPPVLMCWEVRTVSTVPATLDTLEMESPVWVSTVLLFSALFMHDCTCNIYSLIGQ